MRAVEAIDAWHELLTDELAQETQTRLDEQLRRRDLFFGARPLCTVLRPRLLAPGEYATLQRRAPALLSALARAHQAAMADPGFRAQFGLFDWEERLVHDDPGFGEPSPLSRFDALMDDDDGFRLTEYNAETPAGAGFGDVLTEVFLGLPVMSRFLRRFELRPLPVRHHVWHALWDAFHQWRGVRETPRIAILDWNDVPTVAEFRISAEYFRALGVPCVIADPREVEYAGGRLMAGDFHVTLIYKRVLIRELIERGGMDQPVVRAVRDGAVCMVNPFRCKLLHKKLSLAVLSDERNQRLYTAPEREAIAAHVPWTRRVEERTTAYRGETVDLVPYILERRDRFVLKPNDEYGGAGIVLGWEVDDAGWRRAVRAALDEPWVVQERLTLPEETYPSLVDGRVVLAPRLLDTAPFVFQGAFVEGCLSRLSTTALINVTAGAGSSVPTFVVERRAA
jgi:hypothetical protein